MSDNKWYKLFFSNFLGVFNDNFLKNSIIFIAASWILPRWLTHSQVISIVSGCLVVPYLIFSPAGGNLAVRYSKTKVFRIMKLLEIPVVFVAAAAFYFEWIYAAIFAVLLLGTLSCLYSPSKYGLIRDIGGAEGASYGSGVFEAMAFLGVLLGTFSASIVSDHYSVAVLSSILIVVAVLGYFVTKLIKVQESAPEEELSSLNPVKFITENYRFAKGFKLINSAVFGASAFWLIGSLLQMNIIIHCKNVLHVSNSLTGVVMAVAAVGIAAGTAFTGKISKGKVRRELIIFALAGMIISLVVILFMPHVFALFAAMVFVFAFLGGMFQVPSLATIQHENLGRKIGGIIAYLNMVTFSFILVSALLFSVATMISNENSYVVFGVMIVVCTAVLLYFLLRYPDYRKETGKMFSV